LNLKSTRLFLFDLDGVFSVGKENPRYLGGREVIKRLRETGRQSLVLTNDSTQGRETIRKNLTGLGLNFSLDDILTSSYLTSKYLTDRFGKATFYLVGEEGLKQELEAAGHEASEKPQAVVVALDRKLSYEKLNEATRYLRAGAMLVGSYGGAMYMSAYGPALSAGPIVKALEYASGKRAVIIGKPSPRMFQFALRLRNEQPTRAVMVGDQIETDLLGARKAGVGTILVLTGVETKESISQSGFRPDAVIDNVDELSGML
jgi:HAD superfamily hydrolase (TIGR01450 family)